MDWASERYVRLYIRDTADWLMLRWESRALLPLLLRKLDRTGVVDLGKRGRAVLGVLVGLPDEVAQPGLDGLLEDGCIVLDGSVLRSPNFVEAQTTRSSDTVRKEESRRRKQAEKQVTDAASGHQMSPPVTSGHPVSPDVTLAVLSGAVLSGTEQEALSSAGADVSAPPDEPESPGARPEDLQAAWNEHPSLPKWREVTGKRRKAAKARLRERPLDGPDGWREVIRRIAASRFCTGGGENGWRAGPDFLLQPDTATKALEGAYDGAGPAKPAGPPQPPIRKFRSVQEALES